MRNGNQVKVPVETPAKGRAAKAKAAKGSSSDDQEKKNSRIKEKVRRPKRSGANNNKSSDRMDCDEDSQDAAPSGHTKPESEPEGLFVTSDSDGADKINSHCGSDLEGEHVFSTSGGSKRQGSSPSTIQDQRPAKRRRRIIVPFIRDTSSESN